MGGLLYKDFVSLNRIGKVKLTWLWAILTIGFIIFRMVFPGTSNDINFIVKNETGEVINVMDVFFCCIFGEFMIFTFSVISVGKIMVNDEKNKVKSYLATMPLEKNAYVSSKYLFIGISAYVAMSIDYVWGISVAAFCREGVIKELATMINSFIIPFIFLALFWAAIEFPLFFSVGKELAKRIQVVFLTAIAIAVIGYLMFGDLSIFEKWDISLLLDFIEKHEVGILIFQTMEPVIVLVLYYLSYRLSCYFYHKKEGEV